jgi:hypothetical protein
MIIRLGLDDADIPPAHSKIDLRLFEEDKQRTFHYHGFRHSGFAFNYTF